MIRTSLGWRSGGGSVLDAVLLSTGDVMVEGEKLVSARHSAEVRKRDKAEEP